MGENEVEWHGQRSRSPGASNTAGSPGACKFPTLPRAGRRRGARNPISDPCSKGCITPSATTSELAATACQLPSMGTISPLDAFHAAARDATPVA